MTDYKQTDVAGRQHQRAFKISIDNPYLQMPSIVFEEETVVQLDGQAIKQFAGTMREDLTMENMGESFDLVNPLDNTPLGTTATYQELQILLHSAYFHLAAKRDAS